MKTQWGQNNKSQTYGMATTKANPNQWAMLDIAIKAFVRKYPLQWLTFQKELKLERVNSNEFKLDKSSKIHRRHTASFPIIYNLEGREVDALLPVLEKIIPKLTHANSVNYAPFLRKYPMFIPGEKF